MGSALPNSLIPATDELSLFDAPNATGSPERRLLLAVLERAILDFVGNDEKELAEAEEWLFGDLKEPSMASFSFPWVCQQLDLDLNEISRSIAAMPKRGSHKIAPWYFNKARNNAAHAESRSAKISAKVTKVNFPRYHE